MRNVLVIGAAGFIGRSVVQALSTNLGICVLAGVHRLRSNPELGVRQVPVDATNRVSLAAAMAGTDAVVNCMAGSAGAITASADALFGVAANLHPAPLIVHLSSMAAYGSATGDVCEDAPLRDDLGPYSVAKVHAEAAAAAYPRAVILRPGCVYGPGGQQWSGRIARWLWARRLGDLGAAGDGYCNLVHVDDVVAAIVASLERPEATGGKFNLVMSDPPSWNEYLLRYAGMLGAVPVRRIPHWNLDFETRLLALPLRALELGARLAKVKVALPAPIPLSLLTLTGQDIRLLSDHARRVLDWTSAPLELGLAQSAAWFTQSRSEAQHRIPGHAA
jgi:nucleoside-diphosphate-sugar epimerase